MEKNELVVELIELLVKSGHEPYRIPDPDVIRKNPSGDVENMVVTLKSINAGYDRQDAIAQIKCLMEKYNIQVDELIVPNGLA